jgi:hypothetical protein
MPSPEHNGWQPQINASLLQGLKNSHAVLLTAIRKQPWLQHSIREVCVRATHLRGCADRNVDKEQVCQSTIQNARNGFLGHFHHSASEFCFVTRDFKRVRAVRLFQTRQWSAAGLRAQGSRIQAITNTYCQGGSTGREECSRKRHQASPRFPVLVWEFSDDYSRYYLLEESYSNDDSNTPWFLRLCYLPFNTRIAGLVLRKTGQSKST